MDRKMASLCSHGKSMCSEDGHCFWTSEIFHERAGCTPVAAGTNYRHWINNGVMRSLRCRSDDPHLIGLLRVRGIDNARFDVPHLHIRQNLADILGMNKPGLHLFI